MIPLDCVLGGREGLEHEDVEHWQLYRSFRIFRSDLPGWGPKKLKFYLTSPKVFQGLLPFYICSLKNFPFCSFHIWNSYPSPPPPPNGVWYWVKSVCLPGGVGTILFHLLCYHFLTWPRLTVVHTLKALFEVIITEYISNIVNYIFGELTNHRALDSVWCTRSTPAGQYSTKSIKKWERKSKEVEGEKKVEEADLIQKSLVHKLKISYI